MSEPYECDHCDGSGKVNEPAAADFTEGKLIDCANCDGLGVTAIDCPGCGRKAVPISETTFVALYPRTYCETCGDAEVDWLEALAGRRIR